MERERQGSSLICVLFRIVAWRVILHMEDILPVSAMAPQPSVLLTKYDEDDRRVRRYTANVPLLFMSAGEKTTPLG